MRIEDIVSKPVVACRPTDTLNSAARLMGEVETHPAIRRRRLVDTGENGRVELDCDPSLPLCASKQ